MITAARWPAADRLFHADPRWLGSDGAYSVPLRDGRILWLFGDTFVATGPGQSRRESTFVRNTIGIQDGPDPTEAAMTFHWWTSRGAPSSFFAEDGDRWFWPKHGVQLGETLVVFLSRIKLKPHEPCCFNFEGDGWRLAVIDDSSGDPDGWAVDVRAPPARFGALVPEAVNVVGDHAVALAAGADFAGYLVRWRVDDLASGRLGGAEWWTAARGWVPEREVRGRPTRVVRDFGPEASLHFEEEFRRWVLVWTEGFGAATLVVSFAPRLEGPWSAPVEVYHPPEGDRPGISIYAGKGHPELDGADLAVTYVRGADSVEVLLANEGTYYPRFVKLTFSSS